MQWQDRAIVLSVKPYGESKAIVKLFTQNQGIWSGMIRNNSSPSSRALYQLGNIVAATWQSRLEEQLGFYQCELIQAVTAYVMHKPLLLKALYALITVTEHAFLEREPSPVVYTYLEQRCIALTQEEDMRPLPKLGPVDRVQRAYGTEKRNIHEVGEDVSTGTITHCAAGVEFNKRSILSWTKHYIFYEVTLLKTLGFGINLQSCVATGETENLIYVSPKSAQAVSATAGAPYQDKLLPLPAFMLVPTTLDSTTVKIEEILAGLQLTGYFLKRYVFNNINKTLPPQRERFIEALEKYIDTLSSPRLN